MAGNFHFAPGKSFQQGSMHVHDLVPFHTTDFDISHVIHKLSFGKEYPGMHNPLDHVRVPRANHKNPEGSTGMHQYFLKVCTLGHALVASASAVPSENDTVCAHSEKCWACILDKCWAMCRCVSRGVALQLR